ncbi:MAG TPA: hypothetical protein VIP46_02610, partial [Pyrinomonadaceae bacterium]
MKKKNFHVQILSAEKRQAAFTLCVPVSRFLASGAPAGGSFAPSAPEVLRSLRAHPADVLELPG